MRDAEVAEDGLPAPTQQDVGRFDVAVDHPLAVGVGQSIQHVEHNAHDLTPNHVLATHAVVVEARRERVAFKQFHDHVVHVVLHVEVEDLDDIGVTKRRYGLRLALEARLPRLVGGCVSSECLIVHQVGTQDFDRHVTVELRVISAIDARHPAPPKRLQDAVFAERLAFQRSHCH